MRNISKFIGPTELLRLKPELRTFVCFIAIAFAACNKKPAAPVTDAAAATSPSTTTSESDPSKTLDRLTQAVRKYAAETRSAPKSLNELVTAGYLPEVPEAPAGKKFVIDSDLRVKLQ